MEIAIAPAGSRPSGTGPAFATVLLALLALLAVGCGGNGVPGVGEPPSVELLEPGAEPRREMRLAPAVGEEQSSRMTMDMSMGMSVDGRSIPAQPVPTMSFDITAVAAAAGDTVTTDFRYGKVAVAARGADRTVTAELRRTLSGLEGLRGRVVTTAHGGVVDSETRIPSGLDPGVQGLLSQVEQQTASMATPFPAEPIGPGASWVVRASLQTGGVTTELETTHTLRELDGERYVLAVDQVQTTVPGEIEGTPGRITRGSFRASGRIEGTLSSPMPTSSTMQGSGSVSMVVEDDQASMAVDQSITLTATYTPVS